MVSLKIVEKRKMRINDFGEMLVMMLMRDIIGRIGMRGDYEEMVVMMLMKDIVGRIVMRGDCEGMIVKMLMKDFVGRIVMRGDYGESGVEIMIVKNVDLKERRV